MGEHTAGKGAKEADPSFLGYGCNYTFSESHFCSGQIPVPFSYLVLTFAKLLLILSSYQFLFFPSGLKVILSNFSLTAYSFCFTKSHKSISKRRKLL